MLMVIFGAGASYDSVPAYPPPPSLVQPHSGDMLNRFHRPPLANQLFENRPLFAEIIETFPACEPIIPGLRAHHPGTVESALQKLQEEAEAYPRGKCQLAAIRYFLAYSIARTNDQWRNVARGVTNYKTLLDQIERARRGTGPVILVTFNYDTMLEEALAGFDLEIETLADYTQKHAFYRVFKPHGSTNWVHLVSEPRLNPTETNVELTRVRLIQRATELRLTNDFSLADPRIVGWVAGRPVLPAIAIPVDKKSHFECPQQHFDQLVSLLPHVTKLLLIGWRATEAHFLELLKAHLKSGVRLYTVAASVEEASSINGGLDRDLSGVFARTSPDGGNNGTGFTNFVLSDRPRRFLTS